jgi:hypothetical protein
MLTDDPFDQSRFARRFEQELSGIRAMILRPEDTILIKLRWADMSGGSEKQARPKLFGQMGFSSEGRAVAS